MASINNVSINLNKIDKSRIKDDGKGGKWLSLDIGINDELDKYNNNVSVAVSQTKDEREAKEKKTYLGNGKTVWTSDNSHPRPERQPAAPSAQQPASPSQAARPAVDDDLPF